MTPRFVVSRATLGTIPFVYYGGLRLQAPGVLIGQALGSALVGLLAIITAFYSLRRL